jgi:hypothetical protein
MSSWTVSLLEKTLYIQWFDFQEIELEFDCKLLILRNVSMIIWSCLIALHRSRPFLPSQFPPFTLLWRNEAWPRRSAERSRVAGAPRGPGSVRSSRPRRQWGIGAPAISRRHGPCARGCTASGVLPWFASPASVWTCARFTVVCAVGMAPPHDGHSRGWPSKVSNAVQDGRNSSHRMAAPTSPAGTSRASEDRRNTQEACRSTHGRPSRGVT